jgi:single-stranded-DNA-specific exonuclease
MMAFQWMNTEPENKKTITSLQQKLRVPESIARLLALRGVHSFEQAKYFFRPNIKHLYDPFLMCDMRTAAERAAKAVRNNEKILIYGDYDVDGTTATALLYLFLSDFCNNVDYYVPHRFNEGYGLSPKGIRYAAETDVDLIISVDCGITAVKEAELARQNNIDLIICDHHNPGSQIPEALAVLDPKRDQCDYPFNGLSGAGVGFKLVQATTKILGLSQKIPFKLLDLLAVSIASDIVPIKDENRLLMWKGLQCLNSQPRPGIEALLDIIHLKPGTIDTTNIVFSIGPRINAAGRMGDASLAVKMLISNSQTEAQSCAHELESINIERRTCDRQTEEEALLKVEKRYNLDETSALVLHDDDWHLGVIGIVASRLVDTYCRPTVMLSTVDDVFKGSARSIDGFDIFNAFQQCEDLLEEYGGHKFAAGLTILPENVQPLRKRLEQIAAQKLNEEDLQPKLNIDCELDLSNINRRFWKLLNQFEPFGPGNMRPLFVSRGVQLVGVPTIVGKGHLKMRVSQNGSGVFNTIGFNMHEYLPIIRNAADEKMEIVYSLEKNYWNGSSNLQLKLRDIHLNG